MKVKIGGTPDDVGDVVGKIAKEQEEKAWKYDQLVRVMRKELAYYQKNQDEDRAALLIYLLDNVEEGPR